MRFVSVPLALFNLYNHELSCVVGRVSRKILLARGRET
jgi:hypothetical protein